MNDVDYMRIIKWVLIVLLAGFIGQFGKSFAKHILEKARRKKAAEMAASSGSTTPTTSLSGTTHPAQTAAAGKPAELENQAQPVGNNARSETVKEEAKKRKKELKARAKLRKKEAKAQNNDTE